MHLIFRYMDNLVESRCLDIGEDALSEADNCDSKCSWMQINSDENAAAELLEEHGLLPPISHRYNWRPVFREWDDGKLYVRMRPVFMEKGRLRSANLTVLMKKGLVLTIAESDGVNAILKKIEKELRGSAKLRKKGCEGLFMMLVRIIVDSSYEYLESLGVKIDRTEMEITTNPGENVLTKLHNMRRDLMAIRRQIWSLRSFSDAMGRSEQMSKEAVEEAMEMHEESLHLMEAHLLPKLRCHFAEFLNQSYLNHLGIFCPPT